MNESLNLSLCEPKILSNSQKGQDSLIEYIFDKIKTTNKFYVEFGAYDGINFCNTRHLLKNKNWSGLLLDVEFENPQINLHKNFITKENICSIFHNHKVPKEFDFLCIDIDGNDYWILEEILKKYSPRVIMVETNVRFDTNESWAMKYDPNWKWDGHKWYGASPMAYKKLSNKYGYSPIYIHLDDMFIIKNDHLNEKDLNKSWESIYPKPLKYLYDSHINQENKTKQTEIDKDKWIEV